MKRPSRNKDKILKKIGRLVVQHHITHEEILTFLKSPPPPPALSKIEILMRWFAHLGSIFIFAGLCIYIGTFWSNMGSIPKITITLGTGVILYGFTIIQALKQKTHEHSLTFLILVSILFQTSGLFVAANEFQQGISTKVSTALIFGIMLIQQIIVLKQIKNSCLVFISVFFWSTFFSAVFDFLHASERATNILVGLSLSFIAYLLDKKHYKSIANFWYLIGSVLLLNGFFELVRKSYFEFTFLGVSALILYLSTILKNKMLLFISTISLLGYIGYFTSKYFIHSTAWPIVLIVLGIVCSSVGFMSLKVCKKYM